MLANDAIKTIVTQYKLLGKDKNIDDIAKKAVQKKQPLGQYLIDKKLLVEEVLFETAATHLNLPFVNLDKQKLQNEALTVVPETSAQEHETIAFALDDKKDTVSIATICPDDLEFFEFISNP